MEGLSLRRIAYLSSVTAGWKHHKTKQMVKVHPRRLLRYREFPAHSSSSSEPEVPKTMVSIHTGLSRILQ